MKLLPVKDIQNPKVKALVWIQDRNTTNRANALCPAPDDIITNSELPSQAEQVHFYLLSLMRAL